MIFIWIHTSFTHFYEDPIKILSSESVFVPETTINSKK